MLSLQVQFKIDMWTFPISFGIVIFSYTSQIFLPTLEGNLVDRSQFTTMLHWTHIAAALFKSLFSYIGESRSRTNALFAKALVLRRRWSQPNIESMYLCGIN